MKERDLKDYYRIFKRDITKYVGLRIDYLKLEIIDTISSVFSKIMTIWVSLLLGIIFVSFLLVSLGLFLGKILGAYYWGFLIVAGIFLLLAILFYLLRNKFLKQPLINSMITSLFDGKLEKNKFSANEKSKKKKK